jgi:hypothetical protein
LACEYLGEQIAKYPHFYITKKVSELYIPFWKIVYFQEIFLPCMKCSYWAGWY